MINNIETTSKQTTTTNDWLNGILNTLGERKEYETKPALKLVENQLTVITVDFSKEFDKYEFDNEGKNVTKRIIPVIHNGECKTFWLNEKNPLFRLIIEKGIKGQTLFKVMQTGNKQTTKYVLVEDDPEQVSQPIKREFGKYKNQNELVTEETKL